jgi:hypothetical protein
MPDPHRIRGELQALLSRPQYSSMFYHRNQFRKPGTPADTPATVAAQTADHIFKANAMVDPVEVVELKGSVELYRTYDGGVRLHSAGTLGRYWFERSIVEAVWIATQKYPPADQRKTFMDFLRSANFVLPEWNDMLQIAVMAVPAGASVVVVRGRGNWKAMRTSPGRSRPGGAPSISAPGDVIDNLGIMPMPGTVQCVVPLFNDSWITQVPNHSPKWPLFT